MIKRFLSVIPALAVDPAEAAHSHSGAAAVRSRKRRQTNKNMPPVKFSQADFFCLIFCYSDLMDETFKLFGHLADILHH